MASSGSFSGSIRDGHYVLRVDWSQTKNVNANTSTVTANIYLVNDWRLEVSGRTDNACSINGTAHTFSSCSINGTGTYYFDTVSQTVSHNSDGTKSLTITATYYIRATLSGTYYDSITATATITLDSIPRASSVSASSVDMGSATTVSISRASSSFTHTLTYSFGSTSGTIATNTTSTSVSWTPPVSLASQIPNAVSGLCTITCTTYNGSTSVGSKSCTLTLTVPASVKPTISNLTATRVNGTVPTAWGIYVQSKSKAKLTISGAAGVNGSTIKSYSISGGGYSGTSSTLDTGFLNTSGTVTFTATVTDSRGRVSDAATVSISVVAYSPPKVSSTSSIRCTSAGATSASGTYIKALCKFSYSSCSSKNTISASVSYKKSTDSTWTSGGTITNNTAKAMGGGNITTDSSYDVRYALTDAFGTIYVTDSVSTASVVMDFKAGGIGLAVGKVSETDKCFEVSEDWEFKVYGKLLSELLGSGGGGIAFASCSTAADVVDKVVTCEDFKELKKGACIIVKFANHNTAGFPKLNVNGTGAKNIVSVNNYVISTYVWKAQQSLFLVYDGVYWVALNTSIANTSYYGLTKLSTSTSSTSTSMAATPSAVKAAYDRNSWTSISLTNALDVAYGGTGGKTAQAARVNLGITATQLYGGALTTGSTTFATGYKLYVIIGQPASGYSRCAVVIPGNLLTTSAVAYQFLDESYFYSFNISYSGTTVTLAYRSRGSSGQITNIYGIN